MRLVSILLLLSLLVTPSFSLTSEVSSLELKQSLFWHEADITFWQTAPFAVIWSYFLERQISAKLSPGLEPRWNVILSFATFVSAGNALIQANKVVNNARTGNSQ